MDLVSCLVLICGYDCGKKKKPKTFQTGFYLGRAGSLVIEQVNLQPFLFPPTTNRGKIEQVMAPLVFAKKMKYISWITWSS